MEKPRLNAPRPGLSFLFIPFLFLILSFMGCEEKPKVVIKPPPATDIVQKKEVWEDRTANNLKQSLEYAVENNGKLNDSISVGHIRLLNGYYKNNNYNLVWSSRGSSKYIGGKLIDFIKNSREYGLFPQDYGLDRLVRI